MAQSRYLLVSTYCTLLYCLRTAIRSPLNVQDQAGGAERPQNRLLSVGRRLSPPIQWRRALPPWIRQTGMWPARCRCRCCDAADAAPRIGARRALEHSSTRWGGCTPCQWQHLRFAVVVCGGGGGCSAASTAAVRPQSMAIRRRTSLPPLSSLRRAANSSVLCCAVLPTLILRPLPF